MKNNERTKRKKMEGRQEGKALETKAPNLGYYIKLPNPQGSNVGATWEQHLLATSLATQCWHPPSGPEAVPLLTTKAPFSAGCLR